jgi:predicted RNase H-like HicB family nuclease
MPPFKKPMLSGRYYERMVQGVCSMLTAYIKAALRKAQYKILPDGEGYFGTIEGLQGVWANGETLEACREELREALEEWMVLGLKMGHMLPDIDGMTLNIQEVA